MTEQQERNIKRNFVRLLWFIVACTVATIFFVCFVGQVLLSEIQKGKP